MTKRILVAAALLLAVPLTLMAVATAPARAQSTVCGATTTANLVGGDETIYGYATIYNTVDRLYVSVYPNSGYRISQISFHSGSSYAYIPKNTDGSFNWAAFAVQRTYSPTVSTAIVSRQVIWPVGTDLHLAAQVVLVASDGSQVVVWGFNKTYNGTQRYFKHIVQGCETPEPPTGTPLPPTGTPVPPTPVPPTSTPVVRGVQGCSPGYWKQPHHLDSWYQYTPDQSFSSVFGVSIPGYPHLTLLQSLGLNGGGVKALVRNATAALLNAANPYVAYAYTTDEVINMFQLGFSGDAEGYKDAFDRANNDRGVCPLN